MLELEQLKILHDKAYDHGQVPREQASDDLVFAWVTQWDDNLLGESQLQYRGEFNIIRKAIRQIVSDLRSNPVSIDFSPKAESRDDGADLLDGLYRTDDRHNQTIEAYDNAMQEAVVCGVGAWVLHTDYETQLGEDQNQRIYRRPIYEANNNLMWDPNAKLLDKSDAKYCSILWAYSHDGYKELSLMLTGEEDDPVNFDVPQQSYTFPWIGGQDEKIYVTEFYERDKVRDKILTMVDPFGDELKVLESSLNEVMDELVDSGYEIVGERVIERPRVTQYIASGNKILSKKEIAGGNIPVVPVYGERAFIEGEEYYEGITRLAKDPQRLRNFQMSYLADIVSRSPRPKPIFNPEQIQGYEFMYEENGSDSNYPYLLQNRTDANGTPLAVGPVSQMPEQQIPQALAASIDLTRQAVEDVANPGLPQDIADPDLSGKAVIALQNRIDHQSMVYQQNMKHAKRRDAEIYAAMASVIYDAPRNVTLTAPDGSQSKAQVMNVVIDRETGNPVTLNDITNMEWDAHADVGPSYTSKREQTFEQLGNMAAAMPPGDPAQKIIMLEQIQLMEGVQLDDLRKYARNQLILMGIKEPESEEEMAMLMQAQEAQQGQQDPNMLIGQAEMMKAQADLMKEQREAMKDAADIENQQAQTQIDVFKAQTDRQNVQVNAAKAGAEINMKRQDQFAKRVESVAKLRGSAMGATMQ